MHSHYIVKPNLVLRLGWGFDNFTIELRHVHMEEHVYLRVVTYAILLNATALYKVGVAILTFKIFQEDLNPAHIFTLLTSHKYLHCLL